MSRPIRSVMFVALMCSIAPVAQALLLNQTPQSAASLSGYQWADSEILTEAVDFLRRGERQKAKIKLAEFLKLYPNDPRGSELAGMVLLEEKNYTVAALSFKRALALNGNNPGAYSKLGVALLLQGKNKEAEAVFNKAVSLSPGEPLARRYLGWIEENRGNMNAAGHHYVAALKGGLLPAGAFTEVHLALAKVYNTLGRHEQAVRMLAPYIAKMPLNEQGLASRMVLALAYLELQRGVEAAPLLQALDKALKPGNEELLFLKAYAQLASNPIAARAKLQPLMKQPAYSGRARLLVARSYALEGNSAQAAKELEILAGEVDKDSVPSVLTALAAVHLSAGKPAEAVKALSTYANKYPDSPDILYLLGEMKLQSGDTVGAQTQLKQLIATHASYARAYALLGQIERSQNAFPKAEEYLRKAVTLDSNLANAWVDLAGVYESKKDLAKTESTLKQGLDANPGHAYLQSVLATLYEGTGKDKEANLMYRAILASYPDYVPALNYIVHNLAEHGTDIPGARQYTEKAYEANKHNPGVLNAYGWVLVLANETNKGLPLLEQAARSAPKDPTILYHFGIALMKSGKSGAGKQNLQRALDNGLPEDLRKTAKSYL